MIMLNQPLPEKTRVTTEPLFFPGQIIRHKRYGYVGVIVAVDSTCQAEEAWYQANQTQPQKNQPWYHVLVDGTNQTTYPAQSSLEADPDPNPAPISHPYLELFFSDFLGDRYERNDRPWPG
ncbi:MAG: heat shock protein HspQ [Planctomycetota bacterium]|nr:heat shock protein HspQ [Planctomycetota bacterium]